jgi:hypothetical protein
MRSCLPNREEEPMNTGSPSIGYRLHQYLETWAQRYTTSVKLQKQIVDQTKARVAAGELSNCGDDLERALFKVLYDVASKELGAAKPLRRKQMSVFCDEVHARI